MAEMSIFQQAKAAVPIAAYLASLGISAMKVGKGLRASGCPDTKCSANMDGKPYTLSLNGPFFRCWVCGAAGDVVQAASLHMGVKPHEAARRLMQFTLSRTAASVVNNMLGDIQQQQQALEHVIARLRGHLGCSTEVRQALFSRGLSNQVIEEGVASQGVAGLPAKPDQACLVLEDLVGRSAMEDAGLWRPGYEYPAMAFKPTLFFYGHHAMEIKSLGGKEQGGAPSLRYGIAKEPFKLAGLGDDVLVAKSALDALSLRALGHDTPITGLPGRSSWKSADAHSLPRPEWFADILGKAVIAFDNTEEGNRQAVQLAASLDAAGIASGRLELPADFDANDALMYEIA